MKSFETYAGSSEFTEQIEGLIILLQAVKAYRAKKAVELRDGFGYFESRNTVDNHAMAWLILNPGGTVFGRHLVQFSIAVYNQLSCPRFRLIMKPALIIMSSH